MSEILKSIRRGRRRSKAKTRSSARRWRPALWIAAGVLALAGAWIVIGAVVRAEALVVRHVRVAGIERLDPERIAQLAQRVRGRPILLVDLGGLRAELEALPGVRSAVVARRLPDLVEVRISERAAVARAEVGRSERFVDASGGLFDPVRELPGDEELPRLLGLETSPDESWLAPEDQAALRALEALVKVTGRRPPAGTIVDLTPRDRIVLRPGPDAPALWLDRESPELNLESLFVWKESVTRVAGGRAIDLRFHHRLTVVTDDDGSTTR